MMDSISGFESKVFAKKQKQLSLLHHKGLAGLRSLLLEKGWVLSIIGFLLGRAVILSTVSPFAIAFLATVWFIKRSEEHTSELQSRGHLVCRLLLEKKNKLSIDDEVAS